LAKSRRGKLSREAVVSQVAAMAEEMGVERWNAAVIPWLLVHREHLDDDDPIHELLSRWDRVTQRVLPPCDACTIEAGMHETWCEHHKPMKTNKRFGGD
jgi:hypothetical protein